MIDRRPHFLFRRRTARATLGTGVVIAGVLPVAGGVAAGLAAVVGLIPAVLTAVVWSLLATAAVGVVVVVIGVLSAAVANTRRDWYVAVAIVTLFVGGVAGAAGVGVRAIQPRFEHWATEAADAGQAVAADLFTVWDVRQVWLWAVVVPAAHVAIAAGYAAVIGGLRVDEWAGRRFRRRWMLCRHRHAGTVRYRCTGCGALLDGLRPSIAGLLYARCVCGRRVPTTDWLGRLDLNPVCGRCDDPLHPDVGRHPEYSGAVLGGPTAEQAGWLQRAVAGLRPAVAAGEPAPVEADPTGSHSQRIRPGRRPAVLHIDRYSDAAVERLPEWHPGYDGVALLLPWPANPAAADAAKARVRRLLTSFPAAGCRRPVPGRCAVCFIGDRPAPPADAGTWADRLARAATASARLQAKLPPPPGRPKTNVRIPGLLGLFEDLDRIRAAEVRWFAIDPPAHLADLASDPAEVLAWMMGLLG